MEGRPISWRIELRDTLKLAGPIVLNQVGHMSMGLVDTLVAGRIGTTSLAGLGLAANFFWTFTNVCVGCLLALDTFFSQAQGARDEASRDRYLAQAWWSCLIVTAVSAVAIALGASLYAELAPASEVRDAFIAYVWNVSPCLPTLYVFFVLQRYWQARYRVLPFTIILVVANALNLWACFALGLGSWGFPKWGVKGLAWATVISRYAMLAAALAFTWYALRPASLRLPKLDRGVQLSLFRLGLPAAGHTAMEVGAFTIATFVAGVLGAVPLAAHHVSLIMAAFTFMFPLGFSAAAAVRVGTFVGAGKPKHARLAGWLCIGLSISVMSLFAMGYILFPRVLLSFFTADRAVVELGARILLLVALFQVADGIQVSTAGALRGLGNTRAAMIANLIGHYPIGLALGLLLCFNLHQGVVGLWGGLAAGLISVAIMLVIAWTRMTRPGADLKPLERH